MAKQLKEIEIPLGAKDSELCGWEYTIPEGMEATIVDNKIIVKKKESEDERVRKAIIDFFSEPSRKEYILNGFTVDDIIAWLKKQGEKKPADKVEPKFKVGDKIVEDNEFGMVGGEITDIDDTHYELDCGGRYIPISHQDNYKLVEEKNSAWSKEDEEIYNKTIKYIKQSYYSEKIVIDWLKSIKERVQPQNFTVTDKELAQAKKEAYNNVLDKIEYDSENPTFDDGWSAAIWYLKKKNIQPKQEWKQENTSDLTDFENAIMHIGCSFFGDNASLDPNDTNVIKEQANLLLELVPSKEWSEEDEMMLECVIDKIGDLGSGEMCKEWLKKKLKG